jgi:hypothetical protein
MKQILLLAISLVLLTPTISSQVHKRPAATKATSGAPVKDQSPATVPTLEKTDVFYYSTPADGSLTPMEKERGSLTAKSTKVRGKATKLDTEQGW